MLSQDSHYCLQSQTNVGYSLKIIHPTGQQAWTSAQADSLRRPTQRVLCRLRQREDELQSSGDAQSDGNGATVKQHRILYDGEPQSGSTHLA